MPQRPGSIWDIVALRTVATPAGTPTATLIATRTVTRIATHTVTTLVAEAEVIHHTTATEIVTLMEETVVTGERGVARPQQEVAGVGIVPLRAPGADAAIVEAHLGAVVAVRQSLDLEPLTTALMPLLPLPRQTPMEGGEPLKQQKIKGRAWCFLADAMCGQLEGDRRKKKKKTWSLSIPFQFHKISQVTMMHKFKAVVSTRNVLSALSNNSVARSVIFVRKNKLSSIAILQTIDMNRLKMAVRASADELAERTGIRLMLTVLPIVVVHGRSDAPRTALTWFRNNFVQRSRCTHENVAFCGI